MCLVYNKQLTENFLIKNKNKESIDLYKIVIKAGSYLFAPIFYSFYKEGENIDPNYSELSLEDKDQVNRCFHCFIFKKDAIKYLKEINSNLKYTKIIKIQVSSKDIIAVGEDNICLLPNVGVKAFTITKSEYQLALRY